MELALTVDSGNSTKEERLQKHGKELPVCRERRLSPTRSPVQPGLRLDHHPTAPPFIIIINSPSSGRDASRGKVVQFRVAAKSSTTPTVEPTCRHGEDQPPITRSDAPVRGRGVLTDTFQPNMYCPDWALFRGGTWLSEDDTCPTSSGIPGAEAYTSSAAVDSLLYSTLITDTPAHSPLMSKTSKNPTCRKIMKRQSTLKSRLALCCLRTSCGLGSHSSLAGDETSSPNTAINEAEEARDLLDDGRWGCRPATWLKGEGGSKDAAEALDEEAALRTRLASHRGMKTRKSPHRNRTANQLDIQVTTPTCGRFFDVAAGLHLGVESVFRRDRPRDRLSSLSGRMMRRLKRGPVTSGDLLRLRKTSSRMTLRGTKPRPKTTGSSSAFGQGGQLVPDATERDPRWQEILVPTESMRQRQST